MDQKVKVGVGASVFITDSQNKTIFRGSYKLTHCGIVVEVELYATTKGLDIVNNKCARYNEINLISDSRTALNSLCQESHNTAEEITDNFTYIKTSDTRLDFFWIRNHNAIDGNKRADRLDKNSTYPREKLFTKNFRLIAIVAILNSCQSEWDSEFISSINDFLKNQDFGAEYKISQLLTEMNNFKFYLIYIVLARLKKKTVTIAILLHKLLRIVFLPRKTY